MRSISALVCVEANIQESDRCDDAVPRDFSWDVLPISRTDASGSSGMGLCRGISNIISAGVYFAPLPTFREICKRKSTMGFQSLPYVVSLFSALLWLYYALIKGGDTFLLISINSLGTFIELIYIVVFLFYATPDTKKQTFKSLTAVMMLFLVISLGTYFPFHAQTRVLFGVRHPMVLVFGILGNIISAGVPNILGFALGVIQMGLYAYYKRASTRSGSQEKKAGKVKEHIINITMLSNSEVHPVDSGRTSEAEEEVVKVDVPITDELAHVKVDVPMTDELVHVKKFDTGGVLVVCAAA
uniref:Bidirectional sugar transporter SWEET n=1 Tax=Tanacetum cinerariifolium TaxID=118510 RepID=A0A6L2NXI5_TANCI|nr:bidirectional sugar transporter N3-like [Tanacetum cinerariifolium]